ncbi:MAG: GvpL/GvpF family gas vesicle protein [Dehalococcoidia bacterium]
MTERHLSSRQTADPGVQDHQDSGKYVYAIIESDDPRSFGNMGIGGRGDSVYTIHHNGLAAVVSDTPVVVYDPTRENAMTHEAVNERVMEDFTVIPMSFGTVFRTEEDVVEFLRHTSEPLRDVLKKMRDKIEFGLKVNWDPDVVLREAEAEREEIRRLKEEITSNHLASTYFARMQLGRLVEQAMNERADGYVREIYEFLRDDAIASRHNKPIGEKMILNAAFLVHRNKAEELQQRVSDIAQKYETQLKFLFTGPWPPYNFVNIRLKLEQAGATR